MNSTANIRTTRSANLPLTVLALALVAAVRVATAQTPEVKKPQPKPQVTRRIVVSIPDRKLALLEDGRIVKIYPVAVGAPQSPSPDGEFQVVQRLENPTYYKPGVVIGPGAQNPLGTRWMGLNVKGFGIHGTNRPGSVGKNASHGCIRLRNRDVEDLFARVRVGDRVSLIWQRNGEVARIFGGESQMGETADPVMANNAEETASQDEARGGQQSRDRKISPAL